MRIADYYKVKDNINASQKILNDENAGFEF